MRAGFLLFFAFCASTVGANGVTFCYWSTNSYKRPGIGYYEVSNLPADLCTHLVWTFIGVHSETAEIIELDLQVPANNITEFIKVKEQNPNLKTVVACGGWGAGSVNFSLVANNETLRGKFVENTVAFLEKYDFDAFDLDWEYPTRRNGSASDLETFVYLLEEFKAAFVGKYQLSVAVGSSPTYIGSAYLVPNISATVDYINMMAYDYYGIFSLETGVNSPLYGQLTDIQSELISSDRSIRSWIEAGAEPSKILLGMGTYGKTFTLESQDNVATGAAITGTGEPGPYTQETGVMSYFEICMDQLKNEWSITEVIGNYVYGNRDNLWVGYDNVNTMYAKGQYAKLMGLGGVMFWAIDLDDFANYCDGSTAYPLINAAVKGYNES